ncbi:MAG: PAS domain S-box protein [Methanomicrobiales archaeon]|nr:PAS domain S-box protein [Methanomicrobiales archaeon]
MVDKRTVLLVEDEPAFARLVLEMFKDLAERPFTLKHAETVADGVAVLRNGGIDVVLLDLNLPDSTGIETVRKIVAEASRVPILVLTSLQDERVGIEALKSGAQDYLFKTDITPGLLARSIKYAIERKKDLEELRASEERFRSIFENTGTSMVTLSGDMRILMVNREFEQVFGYDREEAAALPGFDQILDTNAADVFRRHTSETTTSFHAEMSGKAKGGTHLDLMVDASKIPGSPHWILSIADLTEKKLLERNEKVRNEDEIFLLKTAMLIGSSRTIEDIFRLAGEKLAHRIPNAVIIIGGFDPESKQFGIRSVSGIQQDAAPYYAMGKVFEGMSFRPSSTLKKICERGKLEKLKGGYSPETIGEVPPPVRPLFSSYLRNHKVYVMGFAQGQDLLGFVFIATKKPTNLGNKRILELFVRQASQVMHRKRTEEDLARAQASLHQLVVTSPAVIYRAEILPMHGIRFTYMSENVARLTGYEPAEILFDNAFWSANVFPEDRDQTLQCDIPAGLQKGTATLEYRFKNKEGSFIWLRDEMKLSEDEHTKRIVAHGYWIDITERRHFEEALLLKHSALASSMDPLFITDSELAIVYLNDACLHLWGYSSPDDVLGKSAKTLVHAKSRINVLIKTLVTDGSWEGEVIGTKKDKSSFDAWMTISRVKNESGISCYIGSVRDISAAKKAEKEAKEYQAYLEKLLARRSSELAELQKKLQAEQQNHRNLECANERLTG